MMLKALLNIITTIYLFKLKYISNLPIYLSSIEYLVYALFMALKLRIISIKQDSSVEVKFSYI